MRTHPDVGLMTIKPAARESYRLSSNYSCLLAYPIAQGVRVDFTEFYTYFSLTSNIFGFGVGLGLSAELSVELTGTNNFCSANSSRVRQT